MVEIKVVEPKVKLWATYERTVQVKSYEPLKIVCGMQESIDEEMELLERMKRLTAMTDACKELVESKHKAVKDEQPFKPGGE